MLRQPIYINSYRYLIDYHNAYKDMIYNPHYEEFVMFRNFTFMNEITNTTDIYFVDKSIWYELAKYLDANKTSISNIISWPIQNSKSTGFSQIASSYNDNFTNDSIYYKDKKDNIFEGYEVYDLLDNKGISKPIRCDKIKFYHPNIKVHMNGIVYIENYINGIHFHYICRELSNYESKSETEIKESNFVYSEYKEIWFPNIEDLFSTDDNDNYNVYYRENIDIVWSENNINSGFADKMTKYVDKNGEQLIPLNLLIQPSRIEKTIIDNTEDEDTNISTEHFVKVYLKQHTSIESNYLNNPINIVVFPYIDVDKNTHQYLLDPDLNIGSTSIINNCKFSIYSRLGFNNGIVSIITEFDYPNKDTNKFNSVKDAYEYYYNVTNTEYDDYEQSLHNTIYKDINDVEKLTKEDVQQLIDYWVNEKNDATIYRYKNNDLKLLELWKEMKRDAIRAEILENYDTDENFLGFRIEIATDMKFKHIIYQNNVSVEFNKLDDFAFNLNNIFDSWFQKPDSLICRLSFIDRYLGNIFASNYVYITTEWIKYLINDTNIYKLDSLIQRNKEYIDNKNHINMKEINLKDSNINFINRFNCTVEKKSEDNVEINKTSIPKVLYKPIFYKVQELQKITLKPRISQNIGINLANYMTKVETFKLVINNKQYIEYGRNDIFVIFKINAGEFTDVSGAYDILNQDDEYISSGTYNITR